MHYFYIARCNDNTLYAGYCVDLEARETVHNSGGGAKYTRSRLPIKIVYSESFQTRSEALKREAEVKRWSREKKLALCSAG